MIMPLKSSRFFVLLALLLTPTSPATAQDEDEDEVEFQSGWIGTYHDQQGTAIRRVDATMAFLWQTGRPDERLITGPFRARWEGDLLTRVAGVYQLAARSAGKLRVSLEDEVWLTAESTAEATWTVSEEMELSVGFHSVRATFDAQPPVAELRLFWRGPGFDWEPLNSANMYHGGEASPKTEFFQGRHLAEALRCAACHGDEATLPVVTLQENSAHLNRQWLYDYLRGQGSNTIAREHRRMPEYQLNEQDAADLATYLAAPSQRVARKPLDQKQVKAGRDLFLKRGCVACHRMEQLGSVDWLDGGDLSGIGTKRSLEYLTAWLRDPGKVREHHRMPTFVWGKDELPQMVAYLASTGAPVVTRVAGDPGRGQQLFRSLRCVSCHSKESSARLPSLGRSSDWSQSCAGELENDPQQRPQYRLDAERQRQLRAYFSQRKMDESAEASPWQRGMEVFESQRCVACHARGTAPGIASKLSAVADEHPRLAAELPAVTPPSLNSVGDKLTVEALHKAIRRDGPQRRDWLTVQMPKFDLGSEDEAAVVAFLRGSDEIPADGPQRQLASAPENLGNVGARLVTTDGFGCTSCHAVGKTKPPKAPLNARGPNLAMLGQHINRQWFDRWVRNPSRIVPRMEMPSIKAPIHGVLDEDLDVQLAAVWKVLNEPGFSPPAPNPLRTVRRSGTSIEERAVTLTDVVRLQDGEKLVKPLMIGLANRHNILFDLETGSLAMWWTGDTARQRTEGKTWFWEVASPPTWENIERVPDIRLVRDERAVAPLVRGQFVTEFDWIRYEGPAVRFGYRLAFPGDVSASPLQVEELLLPLVDGDESGVHRELVVRGVPQGWTASVQVRPSTADSKERSVAAQRIVISHPRDGDLDAEWFASRDNRWVIEYRTNALVDQFVEVPLPPTPQPIGDLPDLVPGFRARALAVNSTVMPTGLAWLKDGRMVICSLKGRVWILSEPLREGGDDRMTPLSDELAAPYGVAVGDDYVDVINKYALLRLFDRDADGFAEEVRTVASGWGHTADYHDWALGLPRSDNGGYYISIACQQDDRSLAASRFRGVVAELVPRDPTTVDPRRFEIQPISGGHRFAMGIARNRAGQLFVTDNQGNYNPYNELNHVLPGKRYGFINKWERKPGFNPPLTEPAINIPHPWTRSVNGICFLESDAEDAFGPFTGHLVGCEYDTRRLIRMSLQEVNGQLQGAAYPLSRYHGVEGKSFLGPLVAAVSPKGALYVGGIRDSGWGGSNNIGAITRLDFDPDRLTTGIAEVRATSDGFLIDWTRPVDETLAADPQQYIVESARRESTPKYGGDDIDRRSERLTKVEVMSPMQVRLTLPELRQGYTYEIRVKNIAVDGESFFPAEAFYTMRQVPR